MAHDLARSESIRGLPATNRGPFIARPVGRASVVIIATWTLTLATVTYAAVALWWFPTWTVDDAFITYRYAENLALHGQLTWNVGSDPVEGYTGIALPVLLAAAVACGGDADAASKAIGILALPSLGAIVWSISRRLGLPSIGRALVSLCLFTAPFVFVHATSGLETMLFTCFVSLCFERALSVHAAEHFNRRLWFGFAAAMLGASLVRPEGAALSVALLGAGMWIEWKRPCPSENSSNVAPTAGPAHSLRVLAQRERFKSTQTAAFLPNCQNPERMRGASRAALVASWSRGSSIQSAALISTALYFIPGAIYFAWRLWYYGQLLPNTFYAKSHSGFVAESLVDLAKFAVLYLALPAAVAAAAVARADRTVSRALQTLPWVPIVAFLTFAVACAVVYSRSALVMNFASRFFVPFYPVLVAMIAAAAVSAVSHISPGNRTRFMIGFACVVVAAQVCVHAVRLPRVARDAAMNARLLRDEHIPAGTFLRDVVPEDESIVVVVDAGAIPYVSRRRTIDFGGLNDEFLSHRFQRKTRADEIADYFFESDPAALVFTSRRPDAIDGPEPIRVQDDPRFANYTLARVLSSESWPEYHLLVYVRKDLDPSL